MHHHQRSAHQISEFCFRQKYDNLRLALNARLKKQNCICLVPLLLCREHKSIVAVIQLGLIICRLGLFADNPIYDLQWPGASFALPRLQSRGYKYSASEMSYLAFVSLQSHTNNKSIKQKTATIIESVRSAESSYEFHTELNLIKFNGHFLPSSFRIAVIFGIAHIYSSSSKSLFAFWYYNSSQHIVE